MIEGLPSLGPVVVSDEDDEKTLLLKLCRADWGYHIKRKQMDEDI